ncbi:nucleotide pyrophosphohydrolase [Thermophilibacter mediterraneus]|uniref:nucleotide pyrophosphohydrolase n=1 Tax=Thermophilibacter mediterraneus TaxID=1871031 RepID=UPI00320A783A
MNFSDAQREALAFRDERDWRQFHNAKDLAISISLEAAELLECFQWSGADLNPSLSRERMREELADVMMYCIYFADSVGIDIPSALHDKILRNAEHYPVDKAAGSAKKYTEL